MFLVLALPRSRTFWLSKFLCYGDYDCGHEEARHLRSVDDAKIWLTRPFHGSAETAIAPYWRLLHQINPDLRVVVIRRPVDEVVKSFMALNLGGIWQTEETSFRRGMTRLDGKLDQLSKRLPNVLSVDFHDLDKEETIRAVFAHCLPYPFDIPWWRSIQPLNLQCNMRALARYTMANRTALDRMVKSAVSLSRAQLLATPPKSTDGVTFQQESYETWFPDAAPLFEEHCMAVGEAPDNWKVKNWPLMQRLYEAGFLQITTARSNGRMFGYLMTILNPSLEVRDMISGLNSFFYASKDMPGVGLKLQRASIAALKASGAREAVFYAGVRGDGPRLGALYRRLGAQEFGNVYRLQFKGIN